MPMPVTVPARRYTAHLFAVLATCGLALLSAAPAYAQDDDSSDNEQQTSDTISLDSRTLGFGESLPFQGNHDEITVTVPVPRGLTPTSLEGTVELPGNIERAWIDVESAGRLLRRITLPAAPAVSAPVSIPLVGAENIDNAVAVTLRTTLIPLGNICPADWTGRSLQIRGIRALYTGTPVYPAVVADFLPPVLRQLHLYLPGNPSPAESSAAIDLGTAVVAYYGAQPVRVDVRRLLDGQLVPGTTDGPFERSVVIRESDTTATELIPAPRGSAVLRLTGDNQTLLDQARLITSRVAGIAVSARATVGSMDRPPVLAPVSTNLENLGQTDLSSTSHGRVEVVVGLDQTRLGRASENIRVDLHGSYTPLPGNQSGLISVTAGNRSLASWAAEPSGVIDRWIDVPNDVLRRVTTLTIALQTTGATNQCGLEQPVTLSIDPDSEVLSDPSGTPHPGGFESVPQSLLPRVDVAGTVGGFDDTARAVAVVTGLQSLTAVALDPHWVSLDDAVNSDRPAVLIAADGALPDSVTLPLERTENVTFELTDPATDDTTTITFQAPVDFASIQTTFDGNRQLVVAGSTGVPGELDRTLEWLRASPDRWASLHGDVLFTAVNRDPVQLSFPDSPGDTASSSISRALGWVLTAAGALLLVGILLAGFAVIRRRRTHSLPR